MKKKTINDEVLEVMKSVLTKEEAEEVVPKLTKNINKSEFIATKLPNNPYALITGSFLWENTKEGSKYWFEISKLVSTRLSQSDGLICDPEL
jgi:hypothetical protein